MKVYLAGPMSGIPEHNFPAFRAAAADLRERGIEVESPVEMDEADGFREGEANVPSGSDVWARFLLRDLEVIGRPDVEAVVVLPGWESSEGAGHETRWARSLRKPILAYPTLHPASEGEIRIVNPETGGAKGRKAGRMDLLPWDALLLDVAPHYAVGAEKYDDHNWRKGYDWSLSFGAMMRHAAQFWAGEDYDQETRTPHLAAVVFHALALLVFMRDHPALDDRFATTEATA